MRSRKRDAVDCKMNAKWIRGNGNGRGRGRVNDGGGGDRWRYRNGCEDAHRDTREGVPTQRHTRVTHPPLVITLVLIIIILYFL